MRSFSAIFVLFGALTLFGCGGEANSPDNAKDGRNTTLSSETASESVGERVSVSGGTFTRLSPTELRNMKDSEDFPLVNVHIPFAGNLPATDLSIPYNEIDSNLSGGPADKTLKITVPKMNQIEDDTIPDAAGNDEQALKESAAIHLQGAGFPWQQETNVYLAGHRLGYPNTDSFLAFWDLNKLKKGDEAFVTDSEGTKYTYRVFKSFVVGPEELSVIKPIPGKNILTLQTCTLPDYSKRLIVQAELVEKQT